MVLASLARAWPLLFAACAGTWAGGVSAQTAASAAAQDGSLSFAAARRQLDARSDQLAAADANARARHLDADAQRWLHGPEVDLDLKEIRIQKTLDVPLAPVSDALGQWLSVPVPPLPDEVSLVDRGNRFRPVVSVSMPLYTGGRIGAIQGAAAAAAVQADAETRVQREGLTLQLVQAYFGQALAERVARIRREVFAGLERHLANALQMEREGMASRAQRLQAQVARDEAARDAVKADNDLADAQVALANLLREPRGVRLATPLFVITASIEPLQQAAQAGVEAHPQIDRLGAVREQRSGARAVEQSKFQPQVYVFGQYDMHRESALLTEPDWVVGVGLKYPLFSNVDRSASIAAAREREVQADAALRQARADLDAQARVALNRLDTARRQFLLLESSTDLARENLRLQELSFREGQATSLDVIDARLALGRARTDRAAAAYRFDLALAQLLVALGQATRFEAYLAQADRVIDDE